MKHRTERVAEAVRDALAEVVQRELKDPRIPMIFTITGVKVSRDLQEAQVYFSQLPDDEEAVEETLDALDSASGFLRTALAQRVRMKSTPSLKFFWDDSEQRAQRINAILAREVIPPAPEEEDEGVK